MPKNRSGGFASLTPYQRTLSPGPLLGLRPRPRLPPTSLSILNILQVQAPPPPLLESCVRHYHWTQCSGVTVMGLYGCTEKHPSKFPAFRRMFFYLVNKKNFNVR